MWVYASPPMLALIKNPNNRWDLGQCTPVTGWLHALYSSWGSSLLEGQASVTLLPWELHVKLETSLGVEEYGTWFHLPTPSLKRTTTSSPPSFSNHAGAWRHMGEEAAGWPSSLSPEKLESGFFHLRPTALPPLSAFAVCLKPSLLFVLLDGHS